MNFVDWLNELADLMGGYYDEEDNLCVDNPDWGTSSYAAKEIKQLYQTAMTPREAVSVLQGGMS